MNPDYTHSTAEKMKETCCHVLFFAVLISGVLLAYQAFSKGQMVYLIFGVLPCGLLAAALFIKFYLPKIGEWFSFSLLFPRKFLKKAPVVLSPFIGLLTNEKYQEAFSGLQPLAQQYPENPDVVLLFAQSCMKLRGAEEIGFTVMEQHFALDDRSASKNHLKLLFFYADKAIEYQYTDSLIPVLTREREKEFYTDSERKAIRIRLDSLRRM